MLRSFGFGALLIGCMTAPAAADTGAGGECAGGARVSVYAFMQGKIVDGYSMVPVVSEGRAPVPMSVRPRQKR